MEVESNAMQIKCPVIKISQNITNLLHKFVFQI